MGREAETRTTIRASVSEAARALGDDVATVLGGHRAPGGDRTFETTLSVDLGGGTSVQQAVAVDAGTIVLDGDGLRMPLRWAPAGHHLFPSFDGALEVHDDGTRRVLSLTGHYDVPLGLLGRLGDRAAGGKYAQQSLERLVAEMGERLDTVAMALGPDPGEPADAVIDLRDEVAAPGPEIYLG